MAALIPVGRPDSLSITRALAMVCALLLTGYFVFTLAIGSVGAIAVICCVLLCVVLVGVVLLGLNPDPLRSQYAQETLAIASDMLEDIKGGLNSESAETVCRHLLSETRASTIAVTDQRCVLACVGDLASDFPPGSPIHTATTHYVLDHGIVQSFTRVLDVLGEGGRHSRIPAGIIAPLMVRGHAVGTLKFYFRTPRLVNRTQYALVSGFAELLSTQLAIHELEIQEELTARAEVRALQAQINPHFLFNTLNTIASFTRTDPLRARELLREFSSFYRSTLDNSGSLIPVEREIAQTRRYLTFERARFGDDRIVATFDVEEGVQDAPVPAFVVQPLVENAVRHALTGDAPLHITVSIRSCADDAISIEVSDDGAGMDDETATRLFDVFSAAPDTSSPQGRGAGVAMRNISERIKRFYGPRSYANVASKLGQGTTVTLHLDLLESIFVQR
ncbi:signal transduction histidine kinase, LytS [Coriobacterium glomerans PW2]|uniref:histidine kinase n=1 Tax=Coriobacterium glomerans (strain ATCC 49209 / DSM 20642 / JCM 10262 / PW2) TaxID=700015 RepID=F2N949_CORGP|nr:histidine kinase [Coriobacterium glomerans]AEB07725.1 signal transduction histidine kinase, LytS [Coriobacterium glomerans PW2]